MLTAAQKQHLLAMISCRHEPYKVFEDGTTICVTPMTYGKGRMCIGHVDDRTGYSRGFCYKSPEEAFAASDSWDGTGDPNGWVKNLQTGRYRKDGDPAKEYGPDDKEPA